MNFLDTAENTVNARKSPSKVRLLLIGYLALATALGGLLGWLVIKNAHWNELRDALFSANMTLIAVACVLITVAAYLRGVRWKLLLQNENTGATRLFLIEQTGTALDTLSPVRILDEVVQVGILALRDKLRLGTILATIALQRTFEFATTVLVLGAGALLLPQLRQFLPWIAVGVVFGFASLVALFAVGPLLSRIRILSNIPDRVAVRICGHAAKTPEKPRSGGISNFVRAGGTSRCSGLVGSACDGLAGKPAGDDCHYNVNYILQ